MENKSLFFELLQVVIGNRLGLSRVPIPEEWEEIYEMSKKQSLAGIAFAGVERLPQEQMPPGKRIRQWAVKAEKIQEHNVKVSEDCRVISRFFEENGFDCVILKGQGNFAYYPEWLQGLRSAGDIDVWVLPKGKIDENGNVLALRRCSGEQSSEYGNYNKDNKDNETQSKIATICEHGSLRYGASAYDNENELREARLEHPVRAVIEFCLSKKRGEYVYYHNLDFPVLKATPVEVHYRPTWLYNPFRNRALQRWFASQVQEGSRELKLGSRGVQEGSRELKLGLRGVQEVQRVQERAREFKVYDGYKIPSVEFNVVFQLLHLYKHIFEEGIGLRQLLDYYFVITKYGDFVRKRNATLRNAIGDCYENDIKDNKDNQDNLSGIIAKLGLKEFAGAVMYVMREVFAMPEERMLCRPDEKRGRKLLEEIMIGGNFGKFDDRYNWAETTSGSMDYRGASYAFARLRHNFQFLKDYPSEVLWEPIFRVYHWVWRKFQLWKFE